MRQHQQRRAQAGAHLLCESAHKQLRTARGATRNDVPRVHCLRQETALASPDAWELGAVSCMPYLLYSCLTIDRVLLTQQSAFGFASSSVCAEWAVLVAVFMQMTTAFGEKGLLSHDQKMVYADSARLAKVTKPALFLVGDRDRMCPPEGCRRTYQASAAHVSAAD